MVLAGSNYKQIRRKLLKLKHRKFDTLTDSDVHLLEDHFTKSNNNDLVHAIRKTVASDYTGMENMLYAKYPSIEAFSRTWHSKDALHIKLEIKPF